MIIDKKSQNSFEALRQELRTLSGSGVVAIKSGTEVEDMSFAEIELLRSLSDGIVPLYIKIGGVEARNDIRELDRIGVDGLVSPMVETPYALNKFQESLESCLSPASRKRMRLIINLETISGVNHLEKILSEQAATWLDQVTAARSDLSGSLGLDPDHPTVTGHCLTIVSRARHFGLATSIGGKITPTSATMLIEEVGPDYLNTRHILLSAAALERGAAELVTAALRFEVELYRWFGELPLPRRREHALRSRELCRRIDSAADNNPICNDAV